MLYKKITRKQTSKGLILGLTNKYWVVVMKEEVLDKTCCNFYNKFYRPRVHYPRTKELKSRILNSLLKKFQMK